MPTPLLATVDLHEEPSGDLSLSWDETPGARNKLVPRAQVERLRTLAEAVSLAESQGNAARIGETYTCLSEALFATLDGPERALGQRIAQAEDEGRRLDLVVRAQSADRRALCRHSATWMRWELLPFAETHRRGEPPLQVVLQLGPQRHAAPRLLETGGLRILFMASSPSSLRSDEELDFEREEEEILKAIAPIAERRRARLRVVEEGTLEDLDAALLVERFDVVHLTGHGVITREGPRLVMEDAFGGQRLVSPAEIIDVLKRGKAMPELVMIACCHSAEVRGSVASFAAELVAAGVPSVLGWTRPVRDDLATIAAATVYEQLGASKTPVEARQSASDRLRRLDERRKVPTYAWGTLHLVSRAAAGFRLDDRAAPLSERVARDEIYKYLGRHMRVLQTGFVSRRRLVQRLLRVIARGEHAQAEAVREVGGACVFGMKGVGKSCAVGRVIERAKQRTPELGLVILHGRIDERAVLEAFQQAVTEGGGDEKAEGMLARTTEPVVMRVQRLMEHWRRRNMVIVLDDFEQNLEPRTDSPWLVSAEAAALLEALLPVCTTGKPKLLITSTAAFQVPDAHASALAFEPLGALDRGAIDKLWMRGQASRDLANVSLTAWQTLAERLGRNARVLAWARALCACTRDDELTVVAERAAAQLPVWAPGDEASEEKHSELARLFLEHMAYDQARAAFGEDALTFLRRARVFESAVPKEAFVAFAAGLAVDLDRDLDALANYGLLEVGELDGARAYRVSPLVETELEGAEATRWHEVAAMTWKALADKTASKTEQLSRTQSGWEHALKCGHLGWADFFGNKINVALEEAGAYNDSLRLAERHLEALPASPLGHLWVGYAELKAGRPPSRAATHIQHSYSLLVRALGTEEHPHVAQALYALGGALLAQGDLEGARQALERSRSIYATVHGTEEHRNVAAALQALGCVLTLQGDLGGAREVLERSYDLFMKVHGTLEIQDAMPVIHALAHVLMLQGDFEGARLALERECSIAAKVHGREESRDFAVALHALGHVLMAQGDLNGARRLLERSCSILVGVHGTEAHPDITTVLKSIAAVRMAHGDFEGARQSLERSLELLTKAHGGEETPNLAALLMLLSNVWMARGELAGARQALEYSMSIMAKTNRSGKHTDDGSILYIQANLLMYEGEFERAAVLYRRVLSIQEKLFGTLDHYRTAETELALGWVLSRLGQKERALELLQHGLNVLRKQKPDHPALKQLRSAARRASG